MCYLWAASAFDNIWGCIRAVTTTISLMLSCVTCAQEFNFFKNNYVCNINPVPSVTQLFLLAPLEESLINPVVAEKKL